ncbi:tetratricopeptide repeat protein [Candidatus Poribacteria bacterium]|nr:tetratricopeptide repeat protein [Candidatus Poribacteria bacterium]
METPESAPPSHTPGEWLWRRDGLLAALVFLLSLAAFANSFGNGFVYDDVYMIKDNRRLENPRDFKTFFTDTYTGEQFKDGYRPLSLWSFALDRALFGPGPRGTHGHNIVLNALVAALVYANVFRLLGRRSVAFLTALIFTLHPTHTEIVANGVGRSALLCFLFMMLALRLHLEHVLRERSAGPPFRLLVAAVFFLLALLSKESAATLPGLLFLMEWLVLREGNWRAMIPRLGRYFLYAIPLAVYLAARLVVLGATTPPVQTTMVGASRFQIFLYASETLLRYVGQTIFPYRLVGEYTNFDHLIRPGLGDPMVLLSFAAWVGIAFGCRFLYRRGQTTPLFGIAWFFLAILPMSNLVIIVASIRADRFLFEPSLGFALAFAWVADRGLVRWRAAVSLALAFYLGFYSWRTVTRNLDWSTEQRFWTVLMEQNPGCERAWFFLGTEYYANGDAVRAEEYYRKAVELRRRANLSYPKAQINYALALKNRGELAKAEEELRILVKQAPDNQSAQINLAWILLQNPVKAGEGIALAERAIAINPRTGPSQFTRAEVLRVQGKYDEAAAAYEEAIAMGDDFGAYYVNAAIFYAQMLADTGKPERAIEQYNDVLAHLEKEGKYSASAASGIAGALRGMGKEDEAEAQYRRVIEREPDYYPALINLAQIYLKKNINEDESLELLERAIRQNPSEYSGYFNAAVIHRKRGDLERALEYFTKTTELQPGIAVTWDMKARVLSQMGREDEAREARDRAASLAGK